MSKTARQQGFTLIEVLVALTILGVSLAVLVNAYATGVHTVGAAEGEFVAESIARDLLTKVDGGASLREGNTAGEDQGFAWNLKIKRYGDNVDQQAWPLSLCEITATVSWQAGLRTRSVVLTSLRALPKIQP